jgi:hypothetical protein
VVLGATGALKSEPVHRKSNAETSKISCLLLPTHNKIRRTAQHGWFSLHTLSTQLAPRANSWIYSTRKFGLSAPPTPYFTHPCGDISKQVPPAPPPPRLSGSIVRPKFEYPLAAMTPQHNYSWACGVFGRTSQPRLPLDGETAVLFWRPALRRCLGERAALAQTTPSMPPTLSPLV